MTVEPAVTPPNLTIVEQLASPFDRALAEVARQTEQERLRQMTTRVLIGRQAWKLFGPGYVVEPLQSTYGMQQLVANARQRGFTPESVNAGMTAPEVEVIDIYS